MSLWDRKEVKVGSIRDKDVRGAVENILAMRHEGKPLFKFVEASDHRKGLLVCSRGCCKLGVDGTPPRGGSWHAKLLRRQARQCPREDGDVRNMRRSRRK